MDDNGLNQTEMYRKLAEVNLTAILETRNRLMDENSAAARWIQATLLTLNGGAALGMISTDKIANAGKLLGGGAFSVGVFCSLILAYTTILAARRFIAPTTDLADFWMASAITGQIDADALIKKQSSLLTSVRPWMVAAHLSGWLSTACFFVGVYFIGTNLK